MNYVVFDLEWNQGNQVQQTEHADIPFEVIEIGAVKLNDKYVMINEFSRLIKPEVYRDRYNALAERYKAAKEKLDAIQQEISERTIKREKIEIFLKQLSKANELLTGFDEGLWNTMLDSRTVYSYDKVMFLFKDGSKVEWKIEK